jgi:hypothetical protein
MNLTINISHELYRRAEQVAAQENVSVEELIAAAFEERLVEFERLKDRAARGSYENSEGVCPRLNRLSMTGSKGGENLPNARALTRQ